VQRHDLADPAVPVNRMPGFGAAAAGILKENTLNSRFRCIYKTLKSHIPVRISDFTKK
jgi:hypothetical protein